LDIALLIRLIWSHLVSCANWTMFGHDHSIV